MGGLTGQTTVKSNPPVFRFNPLNRGMGGLTDAFQYFRIENGEKFQSPQSGHGRFNVFVTTADELAKELVSIPSIGAWAV